MLSHDGDRSAKTPERYVNGILSTTAVGRLTFPIDFLDKLDSSSADAYVCMERYEKSLI